MNSHIIVTIMLCTMRCDPADIRVWDGDTFRVGSRNGGAVRIFNIDAPEIEGKCLYESDLAQQSQTAPRLPWGGKVEIQRQDTDRYGRTLAAVRGTAGTPAMLVKEGLARTWSGRREPWCLETARIWNHEFKSSKLGYHRGAAQSRWDDIPEGPILLATKPCGSF